MFNTNLDERISRVVWNESHQQAQAMVEYLENNPGNGTLEGLRNIAINVIGKAGYNWEQKWSPTDFDIPAKNATGKEAYFGMLGLVTTWGIIWSEPPQYIHEILRDERQSNQNKTSSENNFLSLMLEFSEEKHDSEAKSPLTQEEINGNLFVFTSAGFETTANTMGFAVILLALYPEWQSWIQEEIRSLGTSDFTSEYEKVFPKCRRILALMFETLRLYTPVGHSTRAIFNPTSVAGADGHIYHLTPPVDIYVEQSIIHLDPEIWGSDVNEFRPSRWLDDSGSLITMAKGHFLPWSGGPRVCPGVRFSQVEFVATILTLFRSSRCVPLALPGDSSSDPFLKLQSIVRDPVTKLTLQVKNPKEVYLKWTRCDKMI
ncbi:cytochrome P450 [Penicillium hetheringtonii]|uniref:Cytochrome P450 n=1 Tax=Penicillium hetheringtonii TaxID=911720 RepID=A0AAD6DDS3_9EURO|nr:cytochrome P450 [Penicillium hetheringtonii]